MLEFWNDTNVRIFRELRLEAPLRLLDVGAGAGALVARAAAGGLAVQGIEPYWPITSERIQRGFAEALPFADGSFDAVTCISVLEHVDDPKRAIMEMARILRTGGRAFIAVPELSGYPFLRMRGLRHVTSRRWLVAQLGPEWGAVAARPFGLRFVVPVFRRLHLVRLLRPVYWHDYPWPLADMAVFTLERR
jgi:2-polyprenyl-3-methyl-5-hydroxy-6-metoxy-1,4-benzoquinol methylase